MSGGTNFQRTAAWLAACGKKPWDDATVSVQLGCAIEEICELLAALRCPGDGYALLLDRTRTDLEWFAGKLKRGGQMVYVEARHREAVLDAICDIEVTLNGAAYLLGMDKDAADEAVLASNEAKLVDGRPVILAGGKIGKPPGWVAPDLGDFV